ncbi:hypothetical protein [Amycolatopsis panacis]|nr:hypothetical protein [Amycolatopsis panacis]
MLVNRRRRILAAVVVVLALGAGMGAWIAAGSGDSGPRPVTADEASRLAIMRFRDFQAGGRAVTITVPDTAGEMVVTGSVDYRGNSGYAVVKGKGRNDSSAGLIRWTATRVAVRPMPAAPEGAPVHPPADGWTDRALDPTAGPLDRALAIVLGLGNDRPDNAQLLPQNGAAWIAADQVNGRPVDVFTGPESRDRPGNAESVRYWLAADGILYRVRAMIPGETDPVVIDFDTHEFVAIPPAG